MDKELLAADIQAVADKHQVHIKGTATPVNPEVDAFDITAEATAPASTDAGTATDAQAAA